MNCERAQEQMAAALRGVPDPSLDEHLTGCERCRIEFESVKRTWERLEMLPEEEPPVHARARFHDMLEAYQQGLADRERSKASWFSWRSPWQAGALVAACLTIGFFGGRSTTQGSSDSPASRPNEVAALQQEMSSMRQLVTLSLLEQQSAAERLRGVTWSLRSETSDTEVLSALLRTINTDPNVNVRLAAIDAVKKFGDNPVVRRGLVQSLSKQESPLVQVAVVDTLVDLRPRDAKNAISGMLSQPDLDPTVRARLASAVQRLE